MPPYTHSILGDNCPLVSCRDSGLRGEIFTLLAARNIQVLTESPPSSVYKCSLAPSNIHHKTVILLAPGSWDPLTFCNY